MMHAEEAFTEGILVAELFRDDDCENPRHWDGKFLWLGFPHRRYNIGDETINPDDIEIECPTCKGEGRDVSRDVEPVYGEWADGMRPILKFGVNGPDCEDCEGDGRSGGARSLDDIIEWARKEHDAIHVFPTEMLDHSGTAHYLHGGGLRDRWDSGISGLMVFTKKMAEEWGCPTDEAEIRRQMTAELDEYTAWCNGDCWWYRIRLSDDYEPTEQDIADWHATVSEGFTGGLLEYVHAKYDPDDSCGGFVGWEHAVSEAKSALHLHQPSEAA